jgi:hypothetical protein
MSQKKLEVIENKIDKIDSRLNSIDTTLVSQHEVLKEHIRRTELLEEDVAPIKKEMSMFHGALALVGLLCTVATIIWAIVEVIKK